MASEWFTWHRTGWGCIVAGLVSGACGSDLYLMERIEERVGDEWFSLGGGCFNVTDGGSSGGGTVPGAAGLSYEESLSVHQGIAEFTVTVEGEVIEHRVFDEAFMRSGQVEEVLIDVPEAATRRYSFWGAADCERPAPPDIDAYEQAKQAANAG